MTNPDAVNEPQLVPGGPDAVVHDRGPHEKPVGRDLPPELNPATDEAPEEVVEQDDKDQEPEEGISGEDEPEDEEPA